MCAPMGLAGLAAGNSGKSGLFSRGPLSMGLISSALDRSGKGKRKPAAIGTTPQPTTTIGK